MVFTMTSILSTGLRLRILEKIEGEMKRIIKENVPITREVISKDEARSCSRREMPSTAEI